MRLSLVSVALAGAAVATAVSAANFPGVQQVGEYTVYGEEQRLLIKLDKATQTQAIKLASVVSDIWTEKPDVIAYAKVHDLEKLDKLGVDYSVMEMDWNTELQKLVDNGSMPDVNGNIKDPMNVLDRVNTLGYTDEQMERLGLSEDFDIFEELEKGTKLNAADSLDDEDFYSLYHPLFQIEQKFNTYALTIPEELEPNYELIGESIQGRPLRAIQFGGFKNKINGTTTEAPVARHWVHAQGFQHAREWVAGHGALYAFRELIRKYIAGDETTIAILENIRYSYVPVVNTDGYEYTWFGSVPAILNGDSLTVGYDRFWRKNRRDNGALVNQAGLRVVCPVGATGIDLNRNYGFRWGQMLGATDNPCSDTYFGSEEFSEPESKAVEQYLMKYKNLGADFLSGIDFHAFGALLLRPIGWGFIPDTFCPVNQGNLVRVTARAKQAIAAAQGGYEYTNEHASSLYPVSGGADDWFYHTLTDERYGSTPEMRPNNADIFALGIFTGFAPPPSYVQPAGVDCREYIQVMMEDALDVALGVVPRIVEDKDYFKYYDEVFTSDDVPYVDFCSTPDQVDSEDRTEAAHTDNQANTANDSSMSTGAVAGISASAGFVAGGVIAAGVVAVALRKKVAGLASQDQLAQV